MHYPGRTPRVESHSNTSATYREIEDIKDELAAIDEHGERKVGERAKLEARLAVLTSADSGLAHWLR